MRQAGLLFRHEKNGQDLINATQSAGIDLADVDGIRLQKLFEHHPVLAVFAGGNSDIVRLESTADGGMPEDVVWRGRFLYEAVGIQLVVIYTFELGWLTLD